ncbi:hypothetical protein F511_24916 [Dorcoceras hygrometricum]|uniref:Uncharacterized protein n=1 Tax=Dorcoceras hygrometricum TaxID=472368 RepID=A0A2Z7CRI4_9LAMI|nr:hypothetical protein F511_24916 [Dorcoceras hygrometricum]
MAVAARRRVNKPSSTTHAPNREDLCSDREVVRRLVLRSGVFPDDSVITSRIQPRYVFPCVNQNPIRIRLSLFERQDHRGSRRRSCTEDRREYLARGTRCRRILARICSSPSPSPSINTSIILHLQAIPTTDVSSSLGGGGSSAEIIWLHQLAQSVGNLEEEKQDATKEDWSSGYWRNQQHGEYVSGVGEPRSHCRSDSSTGIIDSACKNQLVMDSVQYGPFNTYIPIRSTIIGKSRVARDPIAMHTSWRSNSDIASVTSIGYPHMKTSGESSTTKHRLLHASGPHPIPPPNDPKTNQYNQDLGLFHSTNDNHLESPNEGSSIDHQVTIHLHAQNITMFPTNETWYFTSQMLVSSSGDLILILTAQSTRNEFRMHSDY